MRTALVFIFLTALYPIWALAEKVEFSYEFSGSTLFFRFPSDGSPDEVLVYDENLKNWRLLAKGNISEVTLPVPEKIPPFPERVKVGFQKTDNFNLVIDDRWAFLVTPVGPAPGQGRYLLPDSQVSNIASSLGMQYNSETYRVISYRTSAGPKTILVRRSDGKYRLLAKKEISVKNITYIEGIIKIPDLAKSINPADFENGHVSKIERLRKINEESERLREDLKNVIFGQDGAINALVNSYRELKTNTSSKPRVVLAMGPSGTGKSYTAEAFADLKANGLVMTVKGNEYNAHAGSLDYMKLLGGAKGTTADKEGSLITWLKSLKGKQGVLIIDEGDKMHPEIWLKLMEFFNTGILTDNEGNPIKTENLIIFITTNRGVKRMFPSNSKDWSQEQLDERAKSLTQDQLKAFYLHKDGVDDRNFLPPEVLNRVDEFIPYAPLTPAAAVGIVKKIANDLRDHYEIEFGIYFEASVEVLKELALADFNGSIDGRAVKRNLSKIYSDGLHLATSKLDLKDDDFVHLELSTDAKGQRFLEVRVGTKSSPLAPLSQVKLSPMDDPTQAKRLLNLESDLNLEVFGQREAMHEIAEAAKAHAGINDNGRPLIIFLGGISGNGKTETGRALAKVRYGSENRVAIIPLGGVQNESQFDTIFGISAKYRGGDIERLFEKALRENPEGGVLIFDEISNMGGMDRAMKESLLMKFYDLFEEGRYISPMDGKEYNLDKYTIVLTGNDGQDAFRGMTSDDLLLATWRENKSPDQVRRMLLARGWPQALINRVAIKLLLKPTLSTEISRITKKLLKRELDRFQKQNPSIKLNIPDDFAVKLSRAFFAPDQGARGLRDALETKIRSIFVTSVLNARAKQKTAEPITIDIDLEDTMRTKPYKVKGVPDRKVTLKATSHHSQDTPQTQTADLTEHATSQVLLSTKNARLVGFHEAGHAVVGENTDFITIRGGRAGDAEYYGYARQDHSKRTSLNMDRKQALQRIAVLWAGRKAQELAGYTADSGWTTDLASIRDVMNSYFIKSGLDRDFVGIVVNEKGEPQMSQAKKKLLEKKMAEMEKEGENLAEEKLKAEWSLVRSVVAELLQKGEITGTRFRQLRGNFNCRQLYLK